MLLLEIIQWSHTFFVRYLGFQLKDVRIMQLPNFAIIWHIKLNKCLFSSKFSSFGVELCHKSTVLLTFYAKYVKMSRNYFIMSGFFSKIVQYPRYQDTTLTLSPMGGLRGPPQHVCDCSGTVIARTLKSKKKGNSLL